MKSVIAASLGALLSMAALPGAAAGHFGEVDIDIVSPSGRAFPLYDHYGGRRVSGRDDALRAWVEAEPGAAYAIRVRNTTGQRIGLVIAVDGRNIVNGRPSQLARNEAMYVLDPWESGLYRGWRTGRDRVNEFYFTSAERSYAGAFDDFSAMGLISAAVFREQVDHTTNRGYRPQMEGGGGLMGPQSTPGTGYGEERWSPSRRVVFEAERRPSTIALMRYEWRDTLCERGVIDCWGRSRGEPHNRLWDRAWRTQPGVYAPPPPQQRQYPGDGGDSGGFKRFFRQ